MSAQQLRCYYVAGIDFLFFAFGFKLLDAFADFIKRILEILCLLF